MIRTHCLPVVLVVIAALLLSTGCAEAQEADDSLEDFAGRLEVAFEGGDDTERAKRIRALYHRDGVDEVTGDLLEQASRMLARVTDPGIEFEPVDAEAKFLNVLNGYEYTPNLAPAGYVVLTRPGAEPGNETRIPYARREADGFHVLPAVIRRLVNPDAEPDKQLQMIVMGLAAPASTFEGWCDLALSNGSIQRVTLADQGAGNQTLIQRGQRIVACDVVNTSGRGSLLLRLIEDETTLFEQRVEPPVLRISYRP